MDDNGERSSLLPQMQKGHLDEQCDLQKGSASLLGRDLLGRSYAGRNGLMNFSGYSRREDLHFLSLSSFWCCGT